MRLIWILAIPLLLWSSQALSWGHSGHRTVCEIALRNLTPAARTEVTRLLSLNQEALDRDQRFGEFGYACTYPDRVQNGRDIEHYVNWPRTQTSVMGHSCGVKSPCVLSAIKKDFASLRSTSLSSSRRAMALIFLGHWVGDIHQPLHSSYGDDRGGGRVGTTGLCTYGLHSTWDTCILEREYLGSGQSDQQIRDLAATWDTDPAVSPTLRRTWRISAPWHWAAESYDQAIRPWVGYCIMKQGACWYSESQETWLSDGQGRDQNIDQSYVNDVRPIVRRRIVQAGVRLAHLINQALDPAYEGQGI